MSFWIQTGSPVLLDVDSVADNMADAITMLYPVDTDFLIVSWNLVPIALTYCEDVQVLVDDVVVLLEQLQDPGAESARVYWGSSTFRSEWWLHREGESLVIDSRWDSTLGNYESLLNERARLTVDTSFFVDEWLKVLRRLVRDIAAKAVELENPDMLVRARALLAAAQSPGAEQAGSSRPRPETQPGLGRTASIRFHTGVEDGHAATGLWQAEAGVAGLFTGQAALVGDLLGVPSGIGSPADGQCTVELPEFSAFCAAAVTQYGSTAEGIQRALTVGFIATALVLLDRAGRPQPDAPSAQQQAAWTALRDQHAAVMPR
jgi:hypothetical protein